LSDAVVQGQAGMPHHGKSIAKSFVMLGISNSGVLQCNIYIRLKLESTMHPILRNILAIIAGAVIGSMVNMAFITMSGTIIPPPEGAITTTTEGLKASMHLFEAKHFLFPFIAHAAGTLVGALLAALIAANHKMQFAFGIGVLFLAGGIASAVMLPAPVWFMVVDIGFAYLPMAYIGWKIAARWSAKS
jgi:hypothetical protein